MDDKEQEASRLAKVLGGGWQIREIPIVGPTPIIVMTILEAQALEERLR